ncbi:MAG TPA: hypothetical protein VFE15_16440 [Marmoricola sp.]|nr:hypothetical protein [Marmoricola sp.]
MSPLQRIAMGLVIVLLPADFRIGGHTYDLLIDPVGWLMVLAGVRALRTHLDLDVCYWLAWVAFAVSVPLWFPQIVEHLPQVDPSKAGLLLQHAHKHDKVTEPSVLWAFSLPQQVFGLLLARTIGQAAISQEPRDVPVAGRYGVLQWAFVATILLPPIAFGGDVPGLVRTTLIGIGAISVVFIYQLFRWHRREYLGGPGPLLIPPTRL